MPDDSLGGVAGVGEGRIGSAPGGRRVRPGVRCFGASSSDKEKE
jgi:hypothetical protein